MHRDFANVSGIFFNQGTLKKIQAKSAETFSRKQMFSAFVRVKDSQYFFNLLVLTKRHESNIKFF